MWHHEGMKELTGGCWNSSLAEARHLGRGPEQRGTMCDTKCQGPGNTAQ